MGEDNGSDAGNDLTGLVAAVADVPDESESHEIVVAETAGGMKRDDAKEAELRQQLDAAEEQFKAQAGSVETVDSAVYNQADKTQGPTGALVFLGAQVGDQDAEQFATAFAKQAENNGFTIKRIDAGRRGGSAVCAEQASDQKVAICAWATHDSMGELIPTVPGYDADTLSALMLRVREDVETTPY